MKQNILDVETGLSKFRFSTEETKEESELQSCIESENQQPFHFKEDLFFRGKLIQTKPDHHVLVLCAHHIICDGVSFEILISDLFKYYKQLAEGQTELDVENIINYRTSVAYILNRIANQSEEATGFWHQNFKKKWEEIQLPLDQQRTGKLNFKGKKHTVILSKTTSEKFEKLAYREKVSTYALAVAFLKLALYRWTGSKEITIGSTVAGRDSEKTERQVGYFANTIVLRDFIREEQEFGEFVSEVSKNVLNALQYQYIELENVMKEAHLIRRNGMAVLFDVGLTWYMHENFEDWNQILEAIPLEANQLDVLEPPARSDLWFFVYKKKEELVWEIIYNKSLFHKQTISGFGELLSKTFDEITENSDKKISAYLKANDLIQNNLEFNYELNI